MNDRTDVITETLLKTPIHRHLGLRLIDPDDPALGLEITVGDEHLNNVGVLHGGIFPLCLDVAGYLAAMPQFAPGTNATTVASNTSIARGAAKGQIVQFRGELTKIGRSLVFVRSQAFCDGDAIATAELVKAVVPWPDQSAQA